jgi:hypothetical protein
MATRKISLSVDEELIRRARERDTAAAGKTDGEVIEDALTVYLGDRALDEARAAGALAPDQADRLAVEEVGAVRRARHRAA